MTDEELLALESDILTYISNKLSSGYHPELLKLKVETMNVISQLNRKIYGRYIRTSENTTTAKKDSEAT